MSQWILENIRRHIERQLNSKNVSSCKKQKTESDDTSSSLDIAKTPSVENEVKQDDTAIAEVDMPNMTHKYSSDNDIGLYIKSAKHISDDVKYDLLMNHFKPTETYDFKADANGRRSFRYPWLLQYSPWLAYSSKLKGSFCVYCSLFPQHVSREY